MEKGFTEKEWMQCCSNLQEQYPIFKRRYREKAKQGKVGIIYPGGKGNIPILYSTGKNLPEAWENSLINLWVNGNFIRTQYDQKDSKEHYIQAPSKDCTMIMTVEEPSSEPKIHRSFPGGLCTLEEYRQEVVDGIKNHWIRDPNNPDDHRWEYTYNGRIFNYDVPGLEKSINQFDAMIENIAKSPITRRANIISWKPWEDAYISDPACFQSLWGRGLREHPKSMFELYSDEMTGELKINFNMRFRSRDSYGAAFMNDFAFIELAHLIAEKISEKRGEKVSLGRFVDISDSYHIYGKDYRDFLETFRKGLYQRHFLQREEYDQKARTWNSTDEVVVGSFEDIRKIIPIKIREQDEKYEKGEGLTKISTELFKD